MNESPPKDAGTAWFDKKEVHDNDCRGDLKKFKVVKSINFTSKQLNIQLNFFKKISLIFTFYLYFSGFFQKRKNEKTQYNGFFRIF